MLEGHAFDFGGARMKDLRRQGSYDPQPPPQPARAWPTRLSKPLQVTA
jgi:hypothetical protein